MLEAVGPEQRALGIAFGHSRLQLRSFLAGALDADWHVVAPIGDASAGRAQASVSQRCWKGWQCETEALLTAGNTMDRRG